MLFQIFVKKEELINPLKLYNLMTVAQFQQEIGNQVRPFNICLSHPVMQVLHRLNF